VSGAPVAKSVLLALSASTGGAFAQECEKYEASEDLPHGFREIASGLFPEFKAEFFEFSDGVCTCDNWPFVNRVAGKPAPERVNWACRAATAEESTEVDKGRRQ